MQDPDAQAAHRLLQAMWNKDYQVGSCVCMLRVSILYYRNASWQTAKTPPRMKAAMTGDMAIALLSRMEGYSEAPRGSAH